jgi:hypothetical protein
MKCDLADEKRTQNFVQKNQVKSQLRRLKSKWKKGPRGGIQTTGAKRQLRMAQYQNS